MPTLILMRHSKAVNHSSDDHGRALSGRGRAEATAAGLALAAVVVPDYALVSDAVRTRETWDHVLPAFSKPVPHRVSARLYSASAGTIRSELDGVPAEARAVLVIGHNPGLGDLARALAGTGDPAALTVLRERFSTSAFAVLALQGDAWTGLGRPGHLDRFYQRDDA